MPGRAFSFLLLSLILIAILTTPALLGPLVRPAATAIPETVVVPPTATCTPTPDPFAAIPVATTLGGGGGEPAYSLPTPTPGMLPVPSTTPAIAAEEPIGLLPDNQTLSRPISSSTFIPPAPTPASLPPDRLSIPRLNLIVAVEPVGMVVSEVAPGVVEWGVPDHRAAGWLNTSAPFGLAGNTVLDGHHNIKGEVFRDLWTLQAGDEILLYAGQQERRYKVSEVLILPEKDQPIEVRLANARYIQPTGDERLTLITCWPYENNTHRTVVVAYPDNATNKEGA